MTNNKKFITLDNLKTFARELKTSDFIKASGAIVDVAELPTENIDSSKIYRLVTSIPGKNDISNEYKLFAVNVAKPGDLSRVLEETVLQYNLIENVDYFVYSLADAPNFGEGYYAVCYDMIKQWSAEINNNNEYPWEFPEFYIVEDADELEALYNTWIAEPFEETQEYKDYLANNGASKWYYRYVYIKNTAGLENKAFITKNLNDDLSWNNDQIPNILEFDFSANSESTNYEFEGICALAPNGNVEIDSVHDITELALSESELDKLPGQILKVIDLVTEDVVEPVHTEVLYIRDNNDWKEFGAGGSSDSARSIAYETIAPTKDNEPGKLNYVVLDEEPEEKYEGYIYIINSEDGSSDDGSDISNLPLAAEEDIELIFGIMNIDNDITVEDTTLVVGDDATIDGNEHLLDLDGE